MHKLNNALQNGEVQVTLNAQNNKRSAPDNTAFDTDNGKQVQKVAVENDEADHKRNMQKYKEEAAQVAK